jgi:hypothetical protein
MYDSPEFQLVASIDSSQLLLNDLDRNSAIHFGSEKIRKYKREVNAAADLPVAA